jgi:hypothetical protein
MNYTENLEAYLKSINYYLLQDNNKWNAAKKDFAKLNHRYLVLYSTKSNFKISVANKNLDCKKCLDLLEKKKLTSKYTIVHTVKDTSFYEAMLKHEIYYKARVVDLEDNSIILQMIQDIGAGSRPFGWETDYWKHHPEED